MSGTGGVEVRRLDSFDADFEYKVTGFVSEDAASSARNALTVSPANEFVFRNLVHTQISGGNEGYSVTSIAVGTTSVSVVWRREGIMFITYVLVGVWWVFEDNVVVVIFRSILYMRI